MSNQRSDRFESDCSGSYEPPEIGRKSEPHKMKRIETVLLTVLFFLLGTFLSVQTRDIFTYRKQFLSAKEEYASYQEELDTLLDENAALKESNSELNLQKNALTESVLESQGYSELALSLAEVRISAGLTDVSGEGVTITLDDSESIDYTTADSLNLIHSEDIEYIVALLKSAGATAIEINGERVVYTTSISCNGPTIRINDERFHVPFVITATCDADTTYDILQADSYIQYRKSNYVVIDIAKVDSVTIAAYSDQSVIDKLCNDLGVNVSS